MQKNRDGNPNAKMKYLLETAYVNSWLCFRHNIFRSNAPQLEGNQNQANVKKFGPNLKKQNSAIIKQSSLAIFDSRSRLISQVKGRIKHTDMIES